MIILLLIYWSAAIAIIVSFILLCNNVSIIKKHIAAKGTAEIENELKKAICFQNLPLAKEKLQDLLWNDFESIKKQFPTSEDDRIKQYSNVEKRYSKYLSYLEMEFPDAELKNLK